MARNLNVMTTFTKPFKHTFARVNRMKINDHILELAFKRSTGEATVEELQRLDHLLKKDPEAAAVLKLLFESRVVNEEVSEEDSRRLFAKILDRIKPEE